MTVTSSDQSVVEHVTVNSDFGTIRGFMDRDSPKVAQFLGIRYAEPPVGPLRWLPPTPKPPVKLEHIDATSYGPSCPQITHGPPSLYNSDVREFRINDPTSEDCLSVSIWAPLLAVKSASTRSLPVIVWITGGAYVVGGATIPYQIPTPWIQSSQRHIVVCINYRLNIFGFPYAEGLPNTEQNLGLLDQRLGLEWVHKYIKSFGGDPDRLTHWGQSAGALSVDRHAFSHPAKPLVRNLILNSGTAIFDLPIREPDHSEFSFVAKGLGFPGGDATAELEFMRSVPADSLITFLKNHYEGEAKPTLYFQPIIDECTQFSDYVDRIKAGNFSKLPAIIGTTADEGNSLAPYSVDGVDQDVADGITKTYFLEPANRMTRLRSEHAPTFRFLYKDPAPSSTSSFPNIAPRPWQRAYHSSDLPIIFGTHSIARGPSTPYEEQLSREWQELFVAFAEEGPEGLRSRGWQDTLEGKGVVFGSGERGWEAVDLEDIEGK